MNITRFNSICFTRKRHNFLENFFNNFLWRSLTFFGGYFEILDTIGVISLLTGNHDVMLTLFKKSTMKNFWDFSRIFLEKFKISDPLWHLGPEVQVIVSDELPNHPISCQTRYRDFSFIWHMSHDVTLMNYSSYTAL